jgi:hypothetical protein
MLDRIIMDVIQVVLEIVLVADDVLPVSRLPDASPIPSPARRADGLLDPPATSQRLVNSFLINAQRAA